MIYNNYYILFYIMESLPPENEDNNVEYKRFLVNLTELKFQKLVTQMNRRLEDGDGFATYYIGVEDDGSFYNLTKAEKKESLTNFHKIVKYINAKIVKFENINQSVKIDIIKKNKIEKLKELRIILLGPSGSGKTTLISCLKNNIPDNGKGSSRSLILNHKHEIISGKTSSYSYYQILDEEYKYLIIDSPGDNKYFKTRNYSFLSSFPNFVIFVIKNQDDLDKMDFYNKYINKLNLNILIIQTHIDIYDKIDDENINHPILYYNLLENIDIDYIFKLFRSLETERELRKYLSINYGFDHPDLGTIISGINGNSKIVINSNNKYLIGPINDKFEPININSIHNGGCYSNKMINKNSATLCIKMDMLVKNYRNLIITNKNIIISNLLETYIYIYEHPTKLTEGTIIYIFYNNFISRGKILSLSEEIKNNQFAKVVIFLNPSIPIHKNDIFLIDDLAIRGWGVVL